MKKNIVVFLCLFITKIASAQDITQGTWFNQEKDAKIQLYKQGDKLFGKIVWLNEPLDITKRAKTDKNNPNEKLKNQPIMGLVFLRNFSFNGKNVWENGEIYDVKSGKTYSSKITIVSAKELDIRGYIGIALMGRTTRFTKAD